VRIATGAVRLFVCGDWIITSTYKKLSYRATNRATHLCKMQ